MARKVRQIDNSYRKYSPEVVAKPVDTYVVPAKGNSSDSSAYRNLAASLAGLHGPLARYAKDRYDEQAKEDTAQGQKLYNENPDRLSYHDFSEQRELPFNPHVKKGYLLARAANEAEILRNSIYQAYADGSATVEINGQQVNIAESDDPAAFDTWVRNYTNQFVTENMGTDELDPEIYANVFMPQVVESVKALAGTHIKHRQEVLLTKNVAAHTQVMNDIIRTYDEDGSFHTDGIEGSLELAGRISGIARSMYAQGVPMNMTQEAVYNAIVTFAKQDHVTDREQLLEIAKNISVTDGVTLGNDPDFMLKLQNTIESEQANRERQEERERQQREREREERIEGLQLAMMNEVIAGRPISRALMRELSTADGVKPQEFNAFLSYAEHIANSLRPKGDGAAARAQKKAAESAAELEFVKQVYRQNGIYKLEDVEKSNMSTDDQTKYLRALTGDETAQRKLVQESLYKDIPDILRTQVFINDGVQEDVESDPLTASVFQNGRMQVEDAVRKRIKDDPTLETDPVRLLGVIHDEVTRLAPDINKRRSVMESELRKGTAHNDYNTVSRAGQEKFISDTYAQDLSQLVTEHNRVVSLGKDPSSTDLAKVMKISRKEPAEIERITGMKISNDRASGIGYIGQ